MSVAGLRGAVAARQPLLFLTGGTVSRNPSSLILTGLMTELLSLRLSFLIGDMEMMTACQLYRGAGESPTEKGVEKQDPYILCGRVQ